MAIDVEALVRKPIPESKPPKESSSEEVKDIIRDKIRGTLIFRQRVPLFDIGPDRLGHVADGIYLEKGLLQTAGLEVMGEFGLDPNSFQESERLAIDLTKDKIRKYKRHIEDGRPFYFQRTVNHTASGEESSVHWYINSESF